MTHDPARRQDRDLTRRSLLGGLLAGAAVGLTPGLWTPAGANAGSRPLTIPALREWRPQPGRFELASPVTVAIRPVDADELASAADVLAADLRALTGGGVAVVVRSAVRPGQIALRLDAQDAELGREGYRLDVADAATVTANESAGAFYGTRTLLQLLQQARHVPAGSARDWPRYAERGLMLDIGRKHLTQDWIADRIREMAYLKLNYLHLHFTEDLGWRIESDQRPVVHSEEHLSKAQVRELIDLAERHKIVVVPEIDVPGHMGAALRHYPQFQLRDVAGQAAANKLDYSIPEARQFAFDLFEEYVPLFPGPYFHIGGDEFLPPATYPLYPQLERYAKETYGREANLKDGILGFLNTVGDGLRGHGRQFRVAGDGLGGGNLVRLDARAVAEWWTDFSPLSDATQIPTPQDLLDAGHRIQNIGWYPTYYSNLGIPLPPKPDLEGMYETWAVHRFHGPLYVDGDVGGPWYEVDPTEPHNLGSRLSVWNDDPDAETEEQIAAGIHPRLRVMAQHTWESPPLVSTYAEFETVIDSVSGPPR